MVTLAAGPIWRRSSIDAFVASWERQPGRPRQPRRFFVQHMDMNVGRNGINPTAYFDSLTEAQEACDRLWGSDVDGVRQEIIDSETGERWFRADGGARWEYAKPRS